MLSFLSNFQKTIENARRYIFTRHRRMISPHHTNLPRKVKFISPSEKFNPFRSTAAESITYSIHLESYIDDKICQPIDKIYPMKVKFADSMYRVLLHDSGLDYIISPEKYISLAVPTITRSFARRIVYNARRYKKTVVITVPLDEAIIYMKNLQKYSFTATLSEA
jgi:hypothetical protein